MSAHIPADNFLWRSQRPRGECGLLFLRDFYLVEVTELSVTKKQGDRVTHLSQGPLQKRSSCQAFGGVWLCRCVREEHSVLDSTGSF